MGAASVRRRRRGVALLLLSIALLPSSSGGPATAGGAVRTPPTFDLAVGEPSRAAMAERVCAAAAAANKSSLVRGIEGRHVAEPAGSPAGDALELGVESFLTFQPQDVAARGVLLGSLRPGWRPQTGAKKQKMGSWTVAYPVDGTGRRAPLPRALNGLVPGGNVTLVRASEPASNKWHPLACVNSEAAYFAQRLWITNGGHATGFAARGREAAGDGACTPSRGDVDVVCTARCARACGFGTFDNVIVGPVLSQAMADVQLILRSAEEEGPHYKNVRQAEARRPSTPAARVVAALAPPVVAALAAQLGLRAQDLELADGRIDFGARAMWGCELHSDFHSSQRSPTAYVFSALVYLSDWGVSFTGGETVFVHSMAMAGEEASEEEESLGAQSLLPMTAGQIVQPRFGRVVLFTGGEENLHCRMPNAGRAGATRLEETAPRVSVNLWFQCSGR